MRQRGRTPVREPVRRGVEPRREPESSSLEFAPSWGNIKKPFPPIGKQRKRPPSSLPKPTGDPAQAFKLPELPDPTQLIQEAQKKRKISYPKGNRRNRGRLGRQHARDRRGPEGGR